MKTSLSLVLLILLTVSFVAAQQSESPSIRNFVRVNEQFCTGAQPQLEQLEQLKAQGIKAIINLRQPSEHNAAEEEAKAKELGLRYFNIPVASANPTDEQATEFLKITDDPENRPAFIHCAAGIRAAAFWMIRRVLRDGWKIEDAEKEAEKMGLRDRPHLNEFARKYIEKHRQTTPAGETVAKPVRNFVTTSSARPPSRPNPAAAAGNWPSFRGPNASGIAEGQHLPDQWSGKTGENVLWRTPIPGLAHSSPIVWGNRIYVTTAVSSDPKASFRPGLYGDGDASQDRSPQRWIVYALDKQTGKIIWERVAYEGVPREKRHIKATYANSTPATDGRIVVAWFGSQGVYAYDVNGRFLWKVDLGRLDLGAYDLPSFEWGPASSPIIWKDLVILQCDTQADSFIVALNANTGETVWKTERDELPSWGTPTVAMASKGEELIANASNFIRSYDPRTGKELWRLGKSSKITAPTPIFADDILVVVSGRGPERPIFVVKAGARGDLTLPDGKTSSDAVIWSRTGRGSYMPTPLIYKGILYVLANNGTFDAYNLKTGEEIYRQRLPLIGNGFSASPVAADDKIYLSNEDGEILVVAAGEKFVHLGTNSMGELLMATPALSEGVMYVRSAQSLFAIGRKK